MVNGQSWAHLVRVRPLIKLPYEQLPLSAQTTSIPQRISSARERDAGDRERNRNVNRGRRTGMIDHSVDKHGQVKLVRRQTSGASSWKKGRNEQTNWNTHTHRKSPKRCDRQTDRPETGERERERPGKTVCRELRRDAWRATTIQMPWALIVPWSPRRI